ncbi:MAG: HEAT repeat domain-containing protein [Fuerstiella sp.]|nr:HEAT repeat domain-containing protein [Fuerstiella sp.]
MARPLLIVVVTWLPASILTSGNCVGQLGPQQDYHRDEMALLPAPDWVEMTERGDTDPRLKGMRAPNGIRVDIVASDPVIIDPVGMTFADDGSLFVLEWREATEQIDTTYDVHYQDGTTATVNRKTKNVNDDLKQLRDTNGDGIFDSADMIMNDLEMPSSVLMHDGWMYFPSVGHVIRRRPQTSGSRTWEEEEILRGMCGYHHHQVSGLTIAHDNWMYTTTGDDDNIAEGSDGSRATVLRTGAVFRSRPDGSQLSEFARGFRNPYRNVVFDEVYNMFHVDNDQEDGSKFQGVRLMHLLEGADYGWRLKMGAKCCRTDFARGAVFGERPGKMPSMLKTGRGAPAGLLIYQGVAFPDDFRGLLIYPDVYRMKVRAYEIERAGSTFKVVRQFTLMESDDGMFRPVQAVTGPDGAIYVLDWRTNSGGAGRSWGDGNHGRIYRLTWEGLPDMPAISRGSMSTWQNNAKQSDTDLLRIFASTADFELRERIQKELLTRNTSHYRNFERITLDQSNTLPTRASAFGAACQLNWPAAEGCAKELISDTEPELRRLAAEAIGHHTTTERATTEIAAGLLACADKDPHPAVRRAAALAAGSVAAATQSPELRIQIATALLQTLLKTRRDDVYLFDGILRGIERCGKSGIAQLTNMAIGDDDNRRELATELFLALRTREAARGLDQLLNGDTQTFTESQLGRLLTAHRHIVVHPPIDAAGVSSWLERNPEAPAILQVTALETLGLTGGGRSATVTDLTVKLLNQSDPDIRLSTIKAAGQLRVIAASRPLFEALTDSRRSIEERQEIIRSLALLRTEGWPYADRSDPGVELVLPELIAKLESWKEPLLIADGLWLVGQIKPTKAEPIARRLLNADDPQIISAAVDVLSLDLQQTKELANQLLANQLPTTMRPQIAAALQRHSATDSTGNTETLLRSLYQDGLSLSLEPHEVRRIKTLVTETGNSARGRDVFLRAEKSQCMKCHRVEGVGGSIGPDLNKISQTHTIEKIIESIVDPSKEIKEGFETWTVVTTEGKVYGGLRIEEGPPQFVLRGSNGRDYRIYLDEIEEKFPSKRSLMPDETMSQLTLTEFVDLVAFLKDEQAQKELSRHTAQRTADDR